MPAIAAGASIYVNGTTGNDSYDGSSPTYATDNVGPKKTISAGVSLVSDNGTVHVAAGTYHERVYLHRDMNLVGAGALTTIIEGDDNAHVIEVSGESFQRNMISGFTIRNGVVSGIIIRNSDTAIINDCIITGNSKNHELMYVQSGDGGGVCNDNGTVYMNRCTISENSAFKSGGGIANFGNGTAGTLGVIELNDCTISGNSARNLGGGILNSEGTVRMTNCTISANTLLGNGSLGGGIYSHGSMNVLNCTICNNSTSNPGTFGGGFADFDSTMRFKNTIVSNNTVGNGINNNGYYIGGSGITSLGNNIDSENSCHFNQAADQVNTNPMLGTLQNNGGPTLTHAITAQSPAYNRGSSIGAPAADQRGVSRPQLTYFDIGAFECENGPVIPPPTPTPTSAPKPFNDSPSSPQSMSLALPGNVTAKSINVQPQTTLVNQPVTIAANMTNSGDEPGKYIATLKINGQVEQVKTGTVSGHKAQPISFNVIRSQPGNYTVDINGKQSTFVVIGKAKTGANISTIVVASIMAMMIIAIAFLIVLIVRRQKQV